MPAGRPKRLHLGVRAGVDERSGALDPLTDDTIAPNDYRPDRDVAQLACRLRERQAAPHMRIVHVNSRF